MKKNHLALCICLGAMNAGVALAGPADYVYTPTVEYGEQEIDVKYGAAEIAHKQPASASVMALWNIGSPRFI